MVESHTWLRQSSWNEKDEYYTPKILVNAIIPHIPKGSKVWCPFDTKNSEFVLKISLNMNPKNMIILFQIRPSLKN